MVGILLLAGFVCGEILWSDGTIVNFEIASGTPVCDYDRFVWKQWVNGELVETNSRIDCFRSDGYPSTTCCPEDSSCDMNTGTCTGEPAPEFCYEYNETQCPAFNYNVANRSMVAFTGINNICRGYMNSTQNNKGETCYQYSSNCKCVWDDAEGCIPQVSWDDWNCIDEGRTILGNCSVPLIEKKDDCNDSGYIFYSWKANWVDGGSVSPSWCSDSTRRFRCSTRLLFFTIIGFIAAIVIIIIIYYLLIKKRQKGKRKGRRKSKR